MSFKKKTFWCLIQDQEQFVVVDKGQDIVFFCPCLQGRTTLSACEQLCPRHTSCNRVAQANDVLVIYEKSRSDKLLQKAHYFYIKSRIKYWRTGDDALPLRLAKQCAEDDWKNCLASNGADYCISCIEMWEKEVSSYD